MPPPTMPTERPLCPPPKPPSAPRARAPSGATDCHFHIFGPYDRFPLSPGRSYDAPEAGIDAYRAMAGVLGLSRQIVVQASIFGTDNACTLDAVAAFGRAKARAIAVIDDAVTAPELAKLEAGGVVGVRFNAVSGNGTPLDQIEALAARIAPLGWHLQLYVDGAALIALAPRLSALPVPVVLDHMGGIRAAAGTEDPAFQALRRLLDTGRAWVKLCGYRSSSGPPYADLLAPARALIAHAPERCLWGTDWPHPHLEGRAMPDDGVLLDLLYDWAGTDAAVRRILVDNPAILYGFDR